MTFLVFRVDLLDLYLTEIMRIEKTVLTKRLLLIAGKWAFLSKVFDIFARAHLKPDWCHLHATCRI